jgi:hypothetical protein
MSTRRERIRVGGVDVMWESGDNYARVVTLDPKARRLLGWVVRNRRGVWYTHIGEGLIRTFPRRGVALQWLRGAVAATGRRAV